MTKEGSAISIRLPRRDTVTCAADGTAVAALAVLAVWWGGVACWLLAVAWAAVLIGQIHLTLEARRIRRP